MKIILTRGISGAGKSTWADQKKQDGFFVVSRDEIRSRFFDLNEYFASGQDENFENYISMIEKNEIAAHIYRDHNLIIDNTNLEPHYIQRYVDIFAELSVNPEDVEIKSFPCKTELSFLRNSEAGKNVAKDLIKKQDKLYKNNVAISDFQKDGKWLKCDVLSGKCKVSK
ncbi:MAG: AAA family ATPase [Candidatus Saccharibacteria bacterium]|nr:AAA family ATPase [Candidatus Saccharibacteria bacterium]